MWTLRKWAAAVPGASESSWTTDANRLAARKSFAVCRAASRLSCQKPRAMQMIANEIANALRIHLRRVTREISPVSDFKVRRTQRICLEQRHLLAEQIWIDGTLAEPVLEIPRGRRAVSGKGVRHVPIYLRHFLRQIFNRFRPEIDLWGTIDLHPRIIDEVAVWTHPSDVREVGRWTLGEAQHQLARNPP